jgi:hypothetical protein
MQVVTAEARRVLEQSGRYNLTDTHGVDAQPVVSRSLRNCGCDAGIALKLGADRPLIGVVTRVAQTEYYVSLLITDTRTGKVGQPAVGPDQRRTILAMTWSLNNAWLPLLSGICTKKER